ncbi:MAG: polyprenyl synthetase family protein [Oscillospiraceae bacterium]|nr:polyprenyl synthetase family protein [Oscillospiraceae bacterium]
MNLLNETYAEAIEAELEALLRERDIPQKRLLEAMRYSLLGGGKRLRPLMLLEFCRMCGGDWRLAMPFACALEMIHIYSLIHDDLPCMDDDDMRRGKPACHKVYGEATALLAGSALLSSAFETIYASKLPAEKTLRVARILARASGLDGIAGGQEIDLCRERKFYKATIYRLKTSAMFMAAAEAGCVIAGAAWKLEDAALRFGEAFGMGFQYADDYADGDCEDVILKAALANYKEALKCLDAFQDAAFLREMVKERMDNAGGC